MTALLLFSPLLAQEIPLHLPRTAEGVAAGIGELRSELQNCVSQSVQTDVALIRLHFTVDIDGMVGEVESVLPQPDPALTQCMAAPFSTLQFEVGVQEMPVEVPISVQRTHTASRTVAQQSDEREKGE